jgi:hypothetical protein
MYTHTPQGRGGCVQARTPLNGVRRRGEKKTNGPVRAEGKQNKARETKQDKTTQNKKESQWFAEFLRKLKLFDRRPAAGEAGATTGRHVCVLGCGFFGKPVTQDTQKRTLCEDKERRGKRKRRRV